VHNLAGDHGGKGEVVRTRSKKNLLVGEELATRKQGKKKTGRVKKTKLERKGFCPSQEERERLKRARCESLP